MPAFVAVSVLAPGHRPATANHRACISISYLFQHHAILPSYRQFVRPNAALVSSSADKCFVYLRDALAACKAHLATDWSPGRMLRVDAIHDFNMRPLAIERKQSIQRQYRKSRSFASFTTQARPCCRFSPVIAEHGRMCHLCVLIAASCNPCSCSRELGRPRGANSRTNVPGQYRLRSCTRAHRSCSSARVMTRPLASA